MYGIKQQQIILMRLPLAKQAVVPEADVLFPSSASIHRAYVYISLEFLRPAMWGGTGTGLGDNRFASMNEFVLLTKEGFI